MVNSLVILGVASMLHSRATPPHGEWETLIPDWPVVGIHMTHVFTGANTGRILVWGGLWEGATPARLFNPQGETFTNVDVPAPYDLFCAGHAQLADGTLLVAGGGFTHKKAPFHTLRFNPQGTPVWTEIDQMLFRRWYPTCTTLPNGDVSNFSGWVQDDPESTIINIPEMYVASTGRWTAKPTGEREVDLYL